MVIQEGKVEKIDEHTNHEACGNTRRRNDSITPKELEAIVYCPAKLTSLPSTNWKWAKGASAVARTAFLISSFGLALLYLVACTWRKSSLTDLDLPSKGLNRISTTLTYLNRWVVTSFANFMVVVPVVCLCASLRVVF